MNRVNISRRRNQQNFIQKQVDACRKAGSVRFTVDTERKGGLKPADCIEALSRKGIKAAATTIGDSPLWLITAVVDKAKAA